jgi:hypothetical protein
MLGRLFENKAQTSSAVIQENLRAARAKEAAAKAAINRKTPEQIAAEEAAREVVVLSSELSEAAKRELEQERIDLSARFNEARRIMATALLEAMKANAVAQAIHSEAFSRFPFRSKPDAPDCFFGWAQPWMELAIQRGSKAMSWLEALPADLQPADLAENLRAIESGEVIRQRKEDAQQAAHRKSSERGIALFKARIEGFAPSLVADLRDMSPEKKLEFKRDFEQVEDPEKLCAKCFESGVVRVGEQITRKTEYGKKIEWRCREHR